MLRTMNISTLRLFSFRSSQRLKAVFLVQTISKTSETNNRFNNKYFSGNNQICRQLLNSTKCSFNPLLTLAKRLSTESLDASTYERIADQTLEHLYEELEELVESSDQLKDSDVSLSSGVMTCKLSLNTIYVINKQTPNKQIWFSSPLSGPKRYDYLNGEWIYKRDGTSLFTTFSEELSQILNRKIKIKPLIQ